MYLEWLDALLLGSRRLLAGKPLGPISGFLISNRTVVV